jgi:CelD/BcsL family acetyltransferase involved in cellulose biosynthesis
MSPVTASTSIQIASDFDDPRVAEAWNAVVSTTEHTVFQMLAWKRAWWRSFGRGRLLIASARRDGVPVAIAPLFADSGMLFLVGSGGSDYLDLIGRVPDAEALAQILHAAIELTPGFVGLRFYHVPDASPTGPLLSEAAARLNMDCFDEGAQNAPAMDIAIAPAAAHEATRKKSLVRHENYFLREGGITVAHARNANDIEPHLDAFFDQHVQRWAGTEFPSLFNNPAQRAFYRAIVKEAAPGGWLRFTRIEWQARPIAFHFGFYYRRAFLWYKPTYDLNLAKHSPGEVLLRQLLLNAIAEGATCFDFGLGDEAFKQRFANVTRTVRDWGLYPRPR